MFLFILILLLGFLHWFLCFSFWFLYLLYQIYFFNFLNFLFQLLIRHLSWYYHWIYKRILFFLDNIFWISVEILIFTFFLLIFRKDWRVLLFLRLNFNLLLPYLFLIKYLLGNIFLRLNILHILFDKLLFSRNIWFCNTFDHLNFFNIIVYFQWLCLKSKLSKFSLVWFAFCFFCVFLCIFYSIGVFHIFFKRYLEDRLFHFNCWIFFYLIPFLYCWLFFFLCWLFWDFRNYQFFFNFLSFILFLTVWVLIIFNHFNLFVFSTILDQF